jgi:hypothetical protein
MSFLIAFVAAPWLAATGIYNPQVIDRHHRCLAEPGSFDSLLFESRGNSSSAHKEASVGIPITTRGLSGFAPR